ncbi:hypothetical protein GXP67_20350 [Rhodocytophaga rosea]|uniref:DUF115 domain-containing protein n=1 Tax=Rhodocytophaga rosea TaxID=2704465 RepID=A0A6C0GMK2_9BACT|nr:hypothetical protein [Rhodocytophaga rosea]QHT68832.1 hypothetical protein GXP67_20350 [Rhodocytophaga rosea]
MLSFLKKLTETLLSFLFILKDSKFSTKVKSISGRSGQVIVLGNGPSFRADVEQYSSFFQDKDIICVNNFANSPYYETLKPYMYLFLDNMYWHKEILSEVEAQIMATFEFVNNKTSWPVILLFPFQARGSERLKVFTNPNIQTLFFNHTPVSGFIGIRHWLYKRNLGMPKAQNVLIAALFVGINMGYKKIYLFGADHSWHQTIELNSKNMVCFRDSHFYDNDDAHLIPFYKGYANQDTFTMQELFDAFATMFRGYDMLQVYAQSLGCKIYNFSSKTFVDAFERIKPEQLQSFLTSETLLKKANN